MCGHYAHELWKVSIELPRFAVLVSVNRTATVSSFDPRWQFYGQFLKLLYMSGVLKCKGAPAIFSTFVRGLGYWTILFICLTSLYPPVCLSYFPQIIFNNKQYATVKVRFVNRGSFLVYRWYWRYETGLRLRDRFGPNNLFCMPFWQFLYACWLFLHICIEPQP